MINFTPLCRPVSKSSYQFWSAFCTGRLAYLSEWGCACRLPPYPTHQHTHELLNVQKLVEKLIFHVLQFCWQILFVSFLPQRQEISKILSWWLIDSSCEEQTLLNRKKSADCFIWASYFHCPLNLISELSRSWSHSRCRVTVRKSQV